MITEETISRVKSSLQATKSFLALEVIEQLEKENTELKENHESDKRSLSLIVDKGLKLEKQIEKMKCCGNCCYATNSNIDGTFCNRKAEYTHANHTCEDWS